MLFQRKRVFSSFVTPDFKKRENGNETLLKSGTKTYWNIFFFGDKIINITNTSSIENSNQINARVKDDAHKKMSNSVQ